MMSQKDILAELEFDVPYHMVPNALFDAEAAQNLTVFEKLALIYLIRCSQKRDRRAFPSYALIAKSCSMSRRQAMRCIEGLIEKGFLVKISRRNDKGEYLSNVYRVVLEPLRREEVLTKGSQSATADDTISEAQVHDQGGSDTQSPPWCQTVTTLVTDSHYPSDCQSPKEINNLEKNTLKKQQQLSNKRNLRSTGAEKEKQQQQPKPVVVVPPEKSADNEEHRSEAVSAFLEEGLDISHAKALLSELQHISPQEVKHIAKTVAERYRAGRIKNPVGILEANPKPQIEAILKGEWYPQAPKANRTARKPGPEAKPIFVLPEQT